MKHIVLAALALFVLMATVPEASAVVCARGVYRAGCAGPRGVAVVRRPAVVYHRPMAGCAWVNGVRVCR